MTFFTDRTVEMIESSFVAMWNNKFGNDFLDVLDVLAATRT